MSNNGYRKFQDLIFDEMEFLGKKGEALSNCKVLEDLLRPENSEELDQFIDKLKQIVPELAIGKSRAARERFIKRCIEMVDV